MSSHGGKAPAEPGAGAAGSGSLGAQVGSVGDRLPKLAGRDGPDASRGLLWTSGRQQGWEYGNGHNSVPRASPRVASPPAGLQPRALQPAP